MSKLSRLLSSRCSASVASCCHSACLLPTCPASGDLSTQCPERALEPLRRPLGSSLRRLRSHGSSEHSGNGRDPGTPDSSNALASGLAGSKKNGPVRHHMEPQLKRAPGRLPGLVNLLGAGWETMWIAISLSFPQGGTGGCKLNTHLTLAPVGLNIGGVAVEIQLGNKSRCFIGSRGQRAPHRTQHYAT